MLSRSAMQEAYALTKSDTLHVRVNFISSADGAVTLNGRAGELGSPTDQTLMKVLRSMCDVVLVGAGTVRAEGYGGLSLKAEDLAYRGACGFEAPPRIAIVTNSLELSPEASVFQKSEAKPIIITHENAPKNKLEKLQEIAEIIFAGKIEVDTALALKKLSDLGLNQVLCEGGPHLFGAVLDAEMADEICLTLSPTFVGGAAGRISASEIERDRKYTLTSVLKDDDSLLYLRYQK